MRFLLNFIIVIAFVFSNMLFADTKKNNNSYYPEYPQLNLDNLNIKQVELIKKGEYLAKMGDCIACHTNITPQGLSSAFSGGLPLVTPFGTLYSPNITPDKPTGIGQWTLQDFKRAMQEGRDPHGRNYFPVFPYIYFAKMTNQDIEALYMYFMHITPVKQKNRPLLFPFSLPGSRFALWGWNFLFFFAENNQIDFDKNKSEAWNRGRYIVDGLGHCNMCHTPLNIFGAPKNRYYLTGSFIDGYWAPNITKYGLESASHENIINVFKNNELVNNAGPIAGPMAEVNHNSLQHLTDADLSAIATYLQTVVSEEAIKIVPSKKSPTLKRGKQVYAQSCVMCHQDNTMGAPVIGDGPNWYLRLQDNGLSRLYRHAIDGYNSMPIKGACISCSENDVIAAVNYILHKSVSTSQWQSLVTEGQKKYPVNGKYIYNENCSVCHSTDKAPRIGDQKVWEPLVAKNIDVLVGNTINSKIHPKNGGCKDCSTADIIEAIKYIASQSTISGNYSLW